MKPRLCGAVCRSGGKMSSPPISNGIDAAGSCSVTSSAAVVASSSSSSPFLLPPHCPLLQAFTFDRDARFHFLSQQLLDWQDMARLDATCRSAHQWIRAKSCLKLRDGSLVVTPTTMRSIRHCAWMTPLVRELQIHLRLAATVNEAASTSISLSSVCDDISVFPNCKQLWLRMASSDSNRSEVQRLFEAVPQLTDLVLIISPSTADSPVPPARDFVSIVAHCLSELHRLTNLRRFLVSGIDDPQRAARKFDFSQLHRLRLSEIALRPADPGFVLTSQQIAHLSRCSTLASIDCPLSLLVDDSRFTQAQRDAFDLNGICKLIDARIKVIAEWEQQMHAIRASPNYSSSQPDPLPAVVPLTELDLSATVITPLLWSSLSRLDTLVSLEPQCWSAELTASELSRLTNFKEHLRRIDLDLQEQKGPAFASDAVDAMIGAIAQCKRLCSVRIVGLQLGSVHIAQVSALPELFDLSLARCGFESLVALSHAVRLERLVLFRCTMSSDSALASAASATEQNPAAASAVPPVLAPVRLRSMIPAMQRLVTLRVHDRDPVSAALLSDVNAALRVRLPSLSKYEENSIVEDSEEPSEGSSEAKSAVEHAEAQ